jgi:hypothetical protein
MTEKTSVILTKEELRTIRQALSKDFGKGRITNGAYLRLLAEERLHQHNDYFAEDRGSA